MRHIKLTILTSVLLLLSATIAIAQQSVTFSPQWIPQAQFVGYYVAKDLGFYDEVGLDVNIVHPIQSINNLQMLKSRQSDIITQDLISAITENMNGEKLCNILQTSQSSSLAIISHQPIEKIEDLEGKRIGRWKAGFSLIARSAIDDYKCDVEWIDILGGVNVFLSRAVDANLMMSYNELLTVKETGYDIDDNQVLYFRNFERYNIPEEGLYTSMRFIKKHPDVVDKFRDASIKGWLWARENQEAALDIIMKWMDECNIPTNRVHQRLMLEEILSLQLNESAEPSMMLDERDFELAKELLSRGADDIHEVEYKTFIKR